MNFDKSDMVVMTDFKIFMDMAKNFFKRYIWLVDLINRR